MGTKAWHFAPLISISVEQVGLILTLILVTKCKTERHSELPTQSSSAILEFVTNVKVKDNQTSTNALSLR